MSDRPIHERAGTHIDHAAADKVYGDHFGRRVVRGLIDRRNRVYQAGGKWKDIVRRDRGLVAFDQPVWEQVAAEIERGIVQAIEIVEEKKNWVYLTDAADAVVCAEPFDGGPNAACRDRVGVPLREWGALDAAGEVVRHCGEL